MSNAEILRPRIGAHMSVAGGMSNAVERAVVHGCEALQIFSKNASQWRGKPLDQEDVRRFRRRVDETGITPVVSHASYLINIATTNPALREQSIASLADELDRADALGLHGVVLHPGACTAGTEADALLLAADALRAVFAARPRGRSMVILENTAGQGRSIGYCFEHLASIIAHVDGTRRLGVCLDTCHLVASGYDIVSERGYVETFDRFERVIGLERLSVFHANDSKKPCASRVDRHEHIGRGCLGEEPFRRILHDARFAHLALLIETEKTTRSGRADVIAVDQLDLGNLNTLRRLRGDVT
jgi:deoxyribonuclease-4